MDAWQTYEKLIRLACFLGVFVLMAVLETALPRRARALDRGRRWPSNLGLVALGTVVVRLVFPITAMGVAMAAEARGMGLIPWLGLPP